MPDHNVTGTGPTLTDSGRGRRPGQRWFPTAGTYLTSEGSLVRTELYPPARTLAGLVRLGRTARPGRRDRRPGGRWRPRRCDHVKRIASSRRSRAYTASFVASSITSRSPPSRQHSVSETRSVLGQMPTEAVHPLPFVAGSFNCISRVAIQQGCVLEQQIDGRLPESYKVSYSGYARLVSNSSLCSWRFCASNAALANRRSTYTNSSIAVRRAASSRRNRSCLSWISSSAKRPFLAFTACHHVVAMVMVPPRMTPPSPKRPATTDEDMHQGWQNGDMLGLLPSD